MSDDCQKGMEREINKGYPKRTAQALAGGSVKIVDKPGKPGKGSK